MANDMTPEPESRDASNTCGDSDAMPRPTLARLAELAQAAGLAGLGTDETVDTSARSREILETEYVDYIARRNATWHSQSSGDN